ncbi:MAG: phage minor head protein [Alysiella sp.]|uniref:phage minor head protein n=1 Tax=Alysiella sp. TaxID=1872483 RepID=UPI0026DD3642|nr:phage minor head protein [Alysiella sp.]MDO4434676.1 phage minor head protein [Alysiella sp.]
MQPEMIPLTLIDRAALEHLKSKALQGSFSHYDVWLDQHKYAFTVAKMMDADMLAEVRSAIVDALANGTGFADFQKRLKPYLMARGWWGEAVMIDPLDGQAKTVQLGSTRRLRKIFETNMATAHAASRWQRIERNAKAMPYLRYNPSASNHKRDDHKRYYGLILPVRHPIWQQIFPPNGYGCKCTVTQLTRGQAEREGISEEPNFEFVQVTNPRTGEVVKVPKDITPSFAHNHAKRVDAVLDLAAERHGQDFADDLLNQSDEYLWQRINTKNLNMVDFSEIQPLQSEIGRLLHDKDTGQDKLWEAMPAAQWQVYFGVRLERYDLDVKNPPDFLILEDGVAREQLKTLDFMFTMDGYPQKKIDALNQFFARPNTNDWLNKIDNIQQHLQKADIVPMDLRYLTVQNRIKLLVYVLSLPKEQQNQIFFIIGALS